MLGVTQFWKGPAAQKRSSSKLQFVWGEIVLVVRGGTAVRSPSLEEAVERARGYAAEGEGPSKAAARAARESGFKKGEVYDRMVDP